jgi:hypothetical protein
MNIACLDLPTFSPKLAIGSPNRGAKPVGLMFSPLKVLSPPPPPNKGQWS